ncbi:thiamine-phosphate kinase [candidate division WOR-3 bacterium]|nr:thiamine-phosphate kinase [candidate division WOR-3 bacterium]
MRSKNRTEGELEIIRYLRKWFPERRSEVLRGIGDDAMVLRGGYVISTDSFFEKTHFDLNYFSFLALGRHVMAASLSDIAAMAAVPVAVLVSLCVTKKVDMQAIRELYDGFARLTQKYKCDISGGDIVKCQTFGMTITTVGRTNAPLLRSGAKSGDFLFVTNFLGLAEAGRIVLKERFRKSEYPDGVEKHLFPEPRINEACSIKKYATACIDTSDGLSTDTHHLAEESGVKIVIDAEHLPIHPEVGKLCGLKRYDPTRFILAAGEDFELLFTASGLPKIKGLKVFRIGRVTKGRGVYLAAGGREHPIQPSGYQHIGQ